MNKKIKILKEKIISKIRGFTMIELIVVIVIISILSTIGITALKNNVKKGRDGFRKSGVDTISTMVKLSRVQENIYGYDLTKNEVLDILKKQSVNKIEAKAGNHYFYGYSGKSNFFIVVCGENDDEFFVEGTPASILAVKSKIPSTVCDGSSVPIKTRIVPLNQNAHPTNLDAYTIYELI